MIDAEEQHKHRIAAFENQHSFGRNVAVRNRLHLDRNTVVGSYCCNIRSY